MPKRSLWETVVLLPRSELSRLPSMSVLVEVEGVVVVVPLPIRMEPAALPIRLPLVVPFNKSNINIFNFFLKFFFFFLSFFLGFN